jgi:hypothetical protein
MWQRVGVRARREFATARLQRGASARIDDYRQFLDIGRGRPALTNTHEIAQAAAPDSRAVYFTAGS